jgi:hypothetical protein
MKKTLLVSSTFTLVILGGPTVAVSENVKEEAVCTVDAVAAIPQVLAATGFNSIEQACPHLEPNEEGEAGSFAAMRGGSAAGSAFGFGVWKCIMEWCGYGAKKSDDVPRTKPLDPPILGKPDVAPPDRPKIPEFIDDLERKRKKDSPGLKRIDEDDLPPDYHHPEVSPPSPGDRPVFPAPRKPKYDPPKKPNDTSGEEMDSLDYEEYKKLFPDK